MGYKKKYNPKDYYDIGDVLDRILDLQPGYQFDVKMAKEEVDKMSFRIWQFLTQTKQKHLYNVKKNDFSITVCRPTRTTFEITESEPIPMDTSATS